MNIVCPECGFGREVPDDKIPPRTQLATCPKCSHRFKFREISSPLDAGQDHQAQFDHDDSLSDRQDIDDPGLDGRKGSIWDQLESLGQKDAGNRRKPQPTSASTPADGSGEIPWENLETHGFFPGLFQTIRMAMLRPMEFFGSMPLAGGFTKPLVFFLIISEIQAMAQIVWQMFGLVPGMEDEAGNIVGFSLAGFGSLLILVLLPLMLTVSLYIFAGLTHLCLKLLRSPMSGFEATFRAMCYGRAPLFLSVVPIVGMLVGMIWTFVSTVIGLKQVHRTSMVQAALGLFVPILLFVGLLLFMLSSMQGPQSPAL